MTAEERDVFLFGLVAMHYRRIVEGEIIPHLELREVTVVKNVV